MEEFIKQIMNKRLLITAALDGVTITTETTIEHVKGNYFFVGEGSFSLELPDSCTVTRDDDIWLVKFHNNCSLIVSELDKIR